jgi:hypothetical protein
MLTYEYRWIGNYVVAALLVAAFFHYARKRYRTAWVIGAVATISLCLLIFAFLSIYARYYWKPKPGDGFFTPTYLFSFVSGWPIQTPVNWLLGEDNFVEEHLMIPTALLVWGIAGASIGAALSKAKSWLFSSR